MQYLIDIFLRLRLSNPWNYKASFLISIPYYLLLPGNSPAQSGIPAILAAMVTIIGFAGFGYFTNDLGDIKQDALAGKRNFTSAQSTGHKIAFFLVFTGLTLLPWMWLPFDQLSAGLIGTELLLFIAYAFRPLRLKEKAIAGVLVDSLYAHVVPAMLATHTFMLFTELPFARISYYFYALISWQFILGIRNIFLHQLKDYENDKTSGTRTAVTAIGPEPIAKKVSKFLLPIEFMLFLAMLFFMTSAQWEIGMGLTLYIFWTLLVRKGHKSNISARQPARMANFFLDEFYNYWLPLLILVALAGADIRYIWLLVLHVVLFRNALSAVLLRVKHKLFG